VALSQSWRAHDGRRDDRTLTDVSAITPDRDTPHVVAVNNEAEVTGVDESLDPGSGPSGVAVVFAVAHVEREVVADELAVARGSDRVRSYEPPAPSCRTAWSMNVARNASVSLAFAASSSQATGAGARFEHAGLSSRSALEG